MGEHDGLGARRCKPRAGPVQCLPTALLWPNVRSRAEVCRGFLFLEEEPVTVTCAGTRKKVQRGSIARVHKNGNVDVVDHKGVN